MISGAVTRGEAAMGHRGGAKKAAETAFQVALIGVCRGGRALRA
jgi:hypothetical protein